MRSGFPFLRPTAFALGGWCLLAVMALAPLEARSQEAVDHPVVITVDPATGTFSYSLNPVEAYPQDRVTFSSPGAEEWTVTFQGDTPFSQRVITGSGEQPRTVPILPDAAVGSYKYDVSVTIDGQTFTQDPEIIVRDRFER